MHPFLRQSIGRGGDHGLTQALDQWEASPTPANRRLARACARILASAADPYHRNSAIEAFSHVGTPADLHAIISLQSDPFWMIRCSVASALADVGGKRMAPRIKSLTLDPHPLVRRYAYVALLDSRAPDALPYLLARLPEEADDIALVGLHSALLRLGKPDSIEPLTAYAADPHSHLWSPARDTLKELNLPLPPHPHGHPD